MTEHVSNFVNRWFRFHLTVHLTEMLFGLITIACISNWLDFYTWLTYATGCYFLKKDKNGRQVEHFKIRLRQNPQTVTYHNAKQFVRYLPYAGHKIRKLSFPCGWICGVLLSRFSFMVNPLGLLPSSHWGLSVTSTAMFLLCILQPKKENTYHYRLSLRFETRQKNAP